MARRFAAAATLLILQAVALNPQNNPDYAPDASSYNPDNRVLRCPVSMTEQIGCPVCNDQLMTIAQFKQCQDDFRFCVTNYNEMQATNFMGCTWTRVKKNFLARTSCYNLYEIVCAECSNKRWGQWARGQKAKDKRRCDNICYKNNKEFIKGSGCDGWGGRRLGEEDSEE